MRPRRHAPALAAALLLAQLLWPPAALAIDWLVLVVDRSNSIDDRELALQRRAYARLLSDPTVDAALDGAKVAIVEFDTASEIVVGWTEPRAAAQAYRRKSPDGLRGQTGIGDALAKALALLSGKGGRLVIDVSGDGKENVDPGLLAAARSLAAERSIEVNGLAILNDEEPEIDRYYSQNVINGFVLSVDKAGDFLSALKRKLFYEIAGVWPDRLALGHDPHPPETDAAPR
jgi:Protein of unknown function (DUF1194)